MYVLLFVTLHATVLLERFPGDNNGVTRCHQRAELLAKIARPKESGLLVCLAEV